MGEASVQELSDVIAEAPDEDWRRFMDQYTPTLLAFIERAGDRDEAMETYVRACEQLSGRPTFFEGSSE